MDNGLFIEIMAMIVFASIIGFIALRKIKFGNQAIKSYAYIINADNTISVLPVKSLREEKITLENNSYMVRPEAIFAKKKWIGYYRIIIYKRGVPEPLTYNEFDANIFNQDLQILVRSHVFKEFLDAKPESMIMYMLMLIVGLALGITIMAVSHFG